MTEIYERFEGDVEFFLVYIREAHALDSPVPNLQGPLLQDPVSFSERSQTATQCTSGLNLPMPAVVDGMDDAVNLAYQGFPDRLYLVGRDGNISYAGDRGPRGFMPDALEEAIVAELQHNKPIRRRARL